MRLYLSNMSYPELREIRGFWTRQQIWRRAFGRALATGAFWRFAVASLLVAAAAFAVFVFVPAVLSLEPTATTLVRLGAIIATIVGAGGLSLTLGGDIMRPAMRAVSETARIACPACGHLLRSQLGSAGGPGTLIRCPECGATSPRSLFTPPYRIPDEFLTWPRWTGRRSKSQS